MLYPPFTTEQFIEVFKLYNEAIWPVHIFVYLFGLMALALVFRGTKYTDPVAAGVLAFFWLFAGGVYHIGFFSRINTAAYFFGALFIVQGLLLLIFGVFRSKLRFRCRKDAYGLVGALLMLYALAIYPALGFLLGHGYPYAPMFGVAPCPVTIFTFGLLLWTAGHVPGWLLMVPGGWSIIGSTAAFTWGVREDIGLLVSGLAAVMMLLYRNRQTALARHSTGISPA